MAWWDGTCGEDPKTTPARGSISRLPHSVFACAVASLEQEITALVLPGCVGASRCELQPPASLFLQMFS